MANKKKACRRKKLHVSAPLKSHVPALCIGPCKLCSWPCLDEPGLLSLLAMVNFLPLRFSFWSAIPSSVPCLVSGYLGGELPQGPGSIQKPPD